jgi:hypothetical protein
MDIRRGKFMWLIRKIITVIIHMFAVVETKHVCKNI